MRKLPTWISRPRPMLSVALVALVAALAFFALHALTREIRMRDVRAAFHAIAGWQIGCALTLTALSYFTLTFYDYLALRIIDRPLPWRVAALGSFTSYTLSHNLGLALLTGGSARYRVYSAEGLDGPDVARVIAIASATFWMGVLTITGVALLAHPSALHLSTLAIGPDVTRIVGGAIILAAAGLIALCAYGPGHIRLWGWRLPLPSARQAMLQIIIASIDLTAASSALFLLIPGADPALLPTFILGYALAIIVALVAHVPGGIGVFEAVVIATVPVDRPALFAALVAYRLIYYVLPLVLGLALLLWREIGTTLRGAQSLLKGLAPTLTAALCFVGGAILLLSGSLPGVPGRIAALRDIAPLPFIEASHFAASLVGTGLLLIAPGLYRRLDGAFLAARTLLLAGAIFSLFKGIDYEEAAVCLSIAALLQGTRHAFYRRTNLVARPLSPGWLASVVAVLMLTIWSGFFAFKHVPYDQSLWWDFAWRGDASRFLRATLGVSVLLAGAGLWHMLGGAPIGTESETEWDDVLRILSTADRTDAMLALTGDKRFLLSPKRDAFIMYQVRGGSWIMMADPVGARDAWPDLIWALRVKADAAQGRLLLYQITAEVLEIAIEMGLQIVKYGEEALVDLSTFTLEGSRMRSLRHTERRASRDGAQFEIVEAGDVPALLPELRGVSDAWLDAKGQREKAFSLGRFDADYMAHFMCALVRHEGRIVAFANIWATGDKRELSVDLMRHVEAAPVGTMDFLFARLMLWGREQGYARFSVGLAPLSGIDARRLSPIWAKAAAVLFRHGERLYGFQGLRAYKEKFAPEWRPRYIAGPRGMGLITALRDLNALIGNPGEIDVPSPPSGRLPPVALAS